MTHPFESTEPMTVVSLEVDSFQRLTAANVRPSPSGLVEVQGRNAQGKSSLIEAMMAGLLGKAGASDLPITEGEHGAEVKIDLGEIIVTRKWTRDSGGSPKSKLSVTAADGSTIRSPQGVLDYLTGQFADPVSFLGMRPADQAKTVLGITGLDADLARLEDEAEGIFDRRRDANRDHDRLAQAASRIAEEVRGLPEPPTEGSIEELTAQLQQANETNAEVDRLMSVQRESRERGTELGERRQRLLAEIEQIDVSLEEHRSRWSDADAQLKEVTRVETAPIAEALKAHEDAQRFQGRRDLLASTQESLAQAEQSRESLNADLEAKRAEINELIAGAPFPIDGMSYDSETKAIAINGIPFSKASQAERLKAAAAVALAGTAKIRVMFIRDASLLDHASLEVLVKAAEESGFQVWAEIVANENNGVGIWIEDGVAYDAADRLAADKAPKQKSE